MAKRGRPSRSDLAERAAAQANSAASEPITEPVPDVQVNEPKDDTPPPPARNEPRRLAMEEIEARHMETMGIEPVVEPELKVAAETKTPEPVDVQGEVVAEPAIVENPKIVRVKVDGQEFDVPQADVDEAGGIKAYQKERAADNRLRKSNETLAETRRTQAQIAAWVQSQTPKQPVQSDDEFVQSRIQLINFGTPEEQAVASKELREKLSPPRNDDAIVSKAVNVMRQQEAENQFVAEFQDLVSVPLLLKLIITEKNDRVSKLQAIPDWPSFYRSIGNEFRGAIGRQSQPAKTLSKPTDSTSPVDKEARKASIVNLPTAAARAELSKEDKPETREDTLNQMRKARGIPTG